MRNVWTICRRELYSYFVSPIAWVLLALFAVLAGYFTGLLSSYFVQDTNHVSDAQPVCAHELKR